MAEFAENRDFRTVTLVDRTGKGGTEILYDGVRVVLPRGKAELTVPRFVARWVMGVSTQHMVWTTDDQFVNRFGIKDISEDLAAELGPEAGDISSIELDTGRTEGWDTTGVERVGTRTVEINLPKSLMRERQGTAAASFGERKG